MKNLNSAHVWSLVYVAAVLLANYTALWLIPLPVFGFLSVGTLIFGITFTARDNVHNLGRRYVYTMIAIAALATSVMAVMTQTPMRIVAASFITILIAESVDTEVFQALRGRSWLRRVFVSNGVSIPIDSLLFNLLAFLGMLPVSTVVGLIWGDIVWKYVAGAITAFLRWSSIYEKDSSVIVETE